MAVALNHTTSRDCKFTKCIQTFMGKMAIVALSTEWHWRRGMRKRLPLSSSLSSLLQRIFLCQAGSLPARQQMPCQLLCWQTMPQTPGGYMWHIFSVYRSTAIRFLEMPRRFFVVEQDARIIAVTSGKGEHVRARHGRLAKITGIKNKQRKRWCFC